MSFLAPVFRRLQRHWSVCHRPALTFVGVDTTCHIFNYLRIKANDAIKCMLSPYLDLCSIMAGKVREEFAGLSQFQDVHSSGAQTWPATCRLPLLFPPLVPPHTRGLHRERPGLEHLPSRAEGRGLWGSACLRRMAWPRACAVQGPLGRRRHAECPCGLWVGLTSQPRRILPVVGGLWWVGPGKLPFPGALGTCL